MAGDNNMEKGLLLANKEETARTTLLLVFSTFIIVCASFTFGVSVPVYVAEVTPKHIRGAFTFSNQIGIGLMLLQQLCGMSGIGSYGSTLFELGGFPARIGMTVLSLIVSFTMMFAFGMGALPWVIMSEIFPMDIKVLAGSLVTIANWFTGWIANYCFNFMLVWSPAGTFIISAIVCGVTIVFTWCLVPETQGLTLEEIQLSFAST
uniref:Major facilitator superfamily (MFS) profile domain-containing protein n=1 Tax=Brassica campestris TaxID=3711 RepID=M4FEC0_BRACM